MSDKTFFIIQLLEKLGSPLMAATIVASMRTPDVSGEAAEKKDAENVAAMIGKAIQVSIDLSQKLDLQDNNASADAIRIALAGIASPLIGHQFTMTGNIPGDAELQKIMAGLQSVLTFSDHFAPSADNTMRLEAVGLNPHAETQILDDAQINVQYLFALSPIINAVSAFPFGKTETVLIQEITQTLLDKVKALRVSLFKHTADDNKGKRIDLYLLKTLADMYAACHAQETARLMTLSPSDRENLSETPINEVWLSFDKRIAMLEIMLSTAFGGSLQTVQTSDNAPAPLPQTPETKPNDDVMAPSPFAQAMQKKPEESEDKPEVSDTGTDAAKTDDTNRDEDASGDDEGGKDEAPYNPMSFFSGDKK